MNAQDGVVELGLFLGASCQSFTAVLKPLTQLWWNRTDDKAHKKRKSDEIAEILT